MEQFRSDKQANILAVQRAKMKLFAETGKMPTQQEVSDFTGFNIMTVNAHWNYSTPEIDDIRRQYRHEVPILMQELLASARTSSETKNLLSALKMLGLKEETNATINIPTHQQKIEVEFIDDPEEEPEAQD